MHILTRHRYIQFYLDLVASNENVSLLYHLALKSKTVRDAETQAFSDVCFLSPPRYAQAHMYSSRQNLYACAELAQHLIKAHAKAHSWNLETYPGKVRLPGDILRPLPSAEAANQVRRERCSTRHSRSPLFPDLEDSLSAGGGANLAG